NGNRDLRAGHVDRQDRNIAANGSVRGPSIVRPRKRVASTFASESPRGENALGVDTFAESLSGAAAPSPTSTTGRDFFRRNHQRHRRGDPPARPSEPKAHRLGGRPPGRPRTRAQAAKVAHW